ncbi:MAG: dienelactone hydrolase family protein [Fuerstiella sp.]
MRLHPAAYRDIETPSGLMRTHWFAPECDRSLPTVILYSEIYQMTGPIARTAAMIAGHGYVVAVPEVYHEYAEPGEAFAYDKPGTERGNTLKTTKSVSAYDADCDAVVKTILDDQACNGAIASMGICLGGHLAFRAAMHPKVSAGICLYATDIHQGSLGAGMKDNTLERLPELSAKLLMIWGRQDPHIPNEGRRKIYDAMTAANNHFEWHEFNGEHAFLRDEGHRYDPALAQLVYGLVFAHLQGTIG